MIVPVFIVAAIYGRCYRLQTGMFYAWKEATGHCFMLSEFHNYERISYDILALCCFNITMIIARQYEVVVYPK